MISFRSYLLAFASVASLTPGGIAKLQAYSVGPSEITSSQPVATVPRPAPQKKSGSYFVLPPRPINQYSSGEIIAVPKGSSAPTLGASLAKGELPTGMVLFPNGCIVVVDPSQLSVGTYRFSVKTADPSGATATHALTVKLRPSGQEDADAMYTIRPAQALDAYAPGDALATSQDRDGAIVQTELVKGSLPAGTSLTDDGSVIVDDPSQLRAGQYAAWVATEDEAGGVTLFIITLNL